MDIEFNFTKILFISKFNNLKNFSNLLIFIIILITHPQAWRYAQLNPPFPYDPYTMLNIRPMQKRHFCLVRIYTCRLSSDQSLTYHRSSTLDAGTSK